MTNFIDSRSFLVFMTLSLGVTALAQDGHIDPNANAHRHSLTVARHADANFNLSTATNGLRTATGLLQECDSRVATDQDVATAVTVETSGSLGTFGMSGDGLDVITTAAEMNAALADNTAYIKVVTMIAHCGGPGTGIVGCAPTPGSSMVIVSNLSAANTGYTILHEFGHNQGLNHRGTPGQPIMNGTGFGGTEVNQAEAAAYHVGGTIDGPNRPVDLSFIIDDTGSMTEEIGGVRSALTAHLATFSPSDCEAFQLTTFKDNVTERQLTTDLAIIGGQVSGLTASGGGDCPEASVQAINQVRGNVKDRGRVFFATDASPQAGQNLSAAIAALRGRGVRVDVLLSGDCAPSRFVERPSFNSEDQNEPITGVQSAITAFYELAEQTGGVFAFVPEVNSGETERYRNISFNMMQGTLVPSLALVTPGRAPSGSSAIIAIRGSSTNFQAGTSLSVSGGGVTVRNLRILSPISLEATIDISPGAAIGFRDLIAITGGEIANGVGALEITPAASSPTITSISPSTARQGQTLSVVVTGSLTNFNAASVLDLGSGIDIINANAISPQILEATITVIATAATGFRDVIVITGGEVATENLTGPFSVFPGDGITVPTLVMVNPSSGGPGETLTIEIDGLDTSFMAGLSQVSFEDPNIEVLETMVVSPTFLTAAISIPPNATPGFQDVRVTTGAEVAALLDGFLIEGSGPTSVPTLSTTFMIALAAALLVLGIHILRQKRKQATG